MRFPAEYRFINIPAVFIEKYFGKANPVYILVYISGYASAQSGEAASSAKIAEELNILESDVINAWRHWQKEGLIGVDDDLGEIRFLPIKTKAAPPPEKKPLISETKAVLAAKPKYSINEIDIYINRSTDVRLLFANAERILGKPLDYSEMNLILSFHEWYGLSIDVIEFLLEYCVSMDKTNMNYIERVALDWSDNDINNLERAKAHINKSSYYGEFMREFGQSGKTPNPSQVKAFRKWIDEFKMPADMVKEACSRTYNATGKISLAYAEKIISEWSVAGVRSLAALNKYDEAHKQAADVKKKSGGRPYAKAPQKNRFINYDQRPWDKGEVDEIEKLSMAALLREENGE